MTIKSMLLLGSFGHGAIENFYKQGVEQCGVTVETFDIVKPYLDALNKSILNRIINKASPDIFYKQINERLLWFLGKKRYDVILVFKGMELFPETVKQLRDHAILIANYNPDHPFIFYAPGSGNQHVVNSLMHYDIHFSYAKKIVQHLQSRFNKQAYCIPFGYNSRMAVSQGSTDGRYSGRFLFIGAYDEERAQFLNRLHSDRLHIYGETKWASRNLFRTSVRNAYQHEALYGNNYADAITTSEGILNLLRQQNMLEDSHNMRTFEVPGYGGLLISQRTSEQCGYFEENKEAVFFDSAADLQEKLTYLSAHDNIVRSMKQAAYNRSIRSDYSYDQRSRQLLQDLQTNF